jgi:hypothetical protein
MKIHFPMLATHPFGNALQHICESTLSCPYAGIDLTGQNLGGGQVKKVYFDCGEDRALQAIREPRGPGLSPAWATQTRPRCRPASPGPLATGAST